MEVYQLHFKVFLLKDIPQENSLAAIAAFIDSVLVGHPQWKALHNENCFKNYCFNSFYKPEADGVYKKETVYQIVTRSVDDKLVEYLEKALPNYQNAFMKGLVCHVSTIARKHIASLYSITPVVIKGKTSGYWRDEMNFVEFSERLKVNLIKKYKACTQEELDEDFELHTLLELTNHCPIVIPYKKVKLLADKIQMQVADNSKAQELAFLSLGTGIGELNSRGYGYVNARFL